jgi:hypothetical protein
VISRRTVLRGAGVALALPFLESFGSRSARAGTMPTRFVVITTGQGTLLNRWRPPAREALEMSELLLPLAAHRDKLVVVSGVDNPLPDYHRSNGHNAAGHTLLSANLCTTSASSDGALLPEGSRAEVAQDSLCVGPSIDHYLADRIGAGVPLNLAVNGSGVGENRMYYRVSPEISSSPNGARAEARLLDDPREVFDELLAGRSSDPTPPMPSLRERLRGQRGRVLDSVAGSYSDLSRRVSSGDRLRLEAHAERLHDLESRLGGGPEAIPVTCDPALALDAAYPRPDAWYKAQIDVLVQTLACGVRQVATLHDSEYHGPDFGFLQAPIPDRLASMGAMPLPGGAISDWHAQIHGESGGAPNENENLVAGFTFYATQVAYLLDRMSAIVEPDGNTLLDNSVVLWVSEFGNGGAHSTEDLPVVLAGGAGGRLVGGRHLERDSYTTNDLYTSILNLFDVPDRSFGLNVDGIGHGGIPGIG